MTACKWPVALAAVLTLGACVDHGRYTSAFKAQSQQNLASLRAATEYDAAHQHFDSGDLEHALATVDRSIVQNASVPASHLLRGRILLELGRPAEALTAFDRGEALEPGNAKFAYCRGIVLERLDRREDAFAAYDAASALAPNRAEYRLGAAECLMDLGRFDEARARLDVHGELATHPGLRQALGYLEIMIGEPDAALRAFGEASLLAPGDPVFLEELARAQFSAQRFAQAETSFRRLAADGNTTDRRDLKLMHAACLIALNQPIEARSIYLALTRAGDGARDVQAWNGVVDVALMIHDDRLLRTAADRLLAGAPDRSEGYMALAMWQRRSGDLEGALASARKAIERDSDNPTPRKLEALVLRDLGRST